MAPAKKAPKKKPAPAAKTKPATAKPPKKPTKAAGGLRPGGKAPDFDLPTDGSGRVSLKALRGQAVVVYFYPRDDTPGCTKEACGFNEALPDFSKVNATIVGISKDKEASHARFRDKYGLKFKLAADVDTQAAQAYGVWIEKSLYGRQYMGMDRATFLIDKTGVVRRVWRSVKVPGHVDEVLAAAKAL
jgi:thioredoxin-dependent peroxiredoxin